MGILNVTPDSFSDGGLLYEGDQMNVDRAGERALQMVEEGADIIDIGGESTGPRSKDVSLEEELKRVIPVVKALKAKLSAGLPGHSGVLAVDRSVQISVDTYKAEVARQALEAGADMINDVTALRGDPELVKVLADYPHVPVVLMYAKDPTARTTIEATHYDDVMKTIVHFLEERIEFAVRAGIARERIIVDPGMGAFVSMEPKYSVEILRRLRELEVLKLPILVGTSRKGFVGQILAQQRMARQQQLLEKAQPVDFSLLKPLPVTERLEGSLACAVMAVMNGASIVRVHDVQETRRMLQMMMAFQTT